MLFGKNREVKVDLAHTIYDDLGIPENEEGIVKKIRDVRRRLHEGPSADREGLLFDKSGSTAISRIKFVTQIDNALEVYEKTGDFAELLNRYAWVDMAVFRNLYKDFLSDKYSNLDLDQDTKTRMKSKELNDAVGIRMAYWGIVNTPESKREYDEELRVLRQIQAIEDEKIKVRVLRNKIAKEEIRKKYGRESFDRSDLGGDKIPPYKYGAPTYGWAIREYPRGKQLIFSTNTSYNGYHELDETVEVYAHGSFEWGTMYRQNADRMSFSPTYLDGLCEVISVRKIDKNGNETVAYGIAQTRDLGYFDSLTPAEIKEKEARGIRVMYTPTKEEAEEQEFLRKREERIARRKAQREAMIKANRPKTLEDRLLGVKRFLNKIGFEEVNFPKISDDKESSYIPQATDAIQTFVPSQLRDPNKKYTVFVLSPIRYKLSDEEKTDLAKLRLAEFMLVQAKEKNGHCFGSLSEVNGRASIRVLDETIKACQFASVNPGMLVSGTQSEKSAKVNSLESALAYLEQKDNARTAKREAIIRRRNEVIDFLGE